MLTHRVPIIASGSRITTNLKNFKEAKEGQVAHYTHVIFSMVFFYWVFSCYCLGGGGGGRLTYFIGAEAVARLSAPVHHCRRGGEGGHSAASRADLQRFINGDQSV